MLEELCRSAFYHATRDIVDSERGDFVRLKRESKKQISGEFCDFYSFTSSYTIYSALPMSTLTGRGRQGNKAKTCNLAWIWFNENSDRLCNAYVKLKFSGDIRQGMINAGKFETFFDGFLQDFSRRRENFLENVKTLMKDETNALVSSKRFPQSHGGVANLLKVLTQTMRQQGSSIYTIAKVQYAVCVQAGIYIPEEFITDVLVANEMIQEAGD